MTNKEPVLSYYRVLSVQVPDRELFNNITAELGGMEYAEGDTNFCISWEAFISYIDDDESSKNLEAYDFLTKVYQKAEGEIGDVVFWCDE